MFDSLLKLLHGHQQAQQQQARPMLPQRQMAQPMAHLPYKATVQAPGYDPNQVPPRQRTMYAGDLQETQTVPQVSGQMYGNETYDATGIQGLQNPGDTPMQTQRIHYTQHPQAAVWNDVQQDPYSQYRRIRF